MIVKRNYRADNTPPDLLRWSMMMRPPWKDGTINLADRPMGLSRDGQMMEWVSVSKHVTARNGALFVLAMLQLEPEQRR